MNKAIHDQVISHPSETEVNYSSEATTALLSKVGLTNGEDWEICKGGNGWGHLFESRLSPGKDSVTILYNHDEFVSHTARLEIEAILSGE